MRFDPRLLLIPLVFTAACREGDAMTQQAIHADRVEVCRTHDAEGNELSEAECFELDEDTIVTLGHHIAKGSTPPVKCAATRTVKFEREGTTLETEYACGTLSFINDAGEVEARNLHPKGAAIIEGE